MKISNKQYFALAISMLFVGSATAEVKYRDFRLESSKTQVVDATEMQAATSGNRIAEFDREKLFRCWQRGQLITTESGWRPSSETANRKFFTKGKQTMHLYEFGETFCIYTGE